MGTKSCYVTQTLYSQSSCLFPSTRTTGVCHYGQLDIFYCLFVYLFHYPLLQVSSMRCETLSISFIPVIPASRITSDTGQSVMCSDMLVTQVYYRSPTLITIAREALEAAKILIVQGGSHTTFINTGHCT